MDRLSVVLSLIIVILVVGIVLYKRYEDQEDVRQNKELKNALDNIKSIKESDTLTLQEKQRALSAAQDELNAAIISRNQKSEEITKRDEKIATLEKQIKYADSLLRFCVFVFGMNHHIRELYRVNTTGGGGNKITYMDITPRADLLIPAGAVGMCINLQYYVPEGIVAGQPISFLVKCTGNSINSLRIFGYEKPNLKIRTELNVKRVINDNTYDPNTVISANGGDRLVIHPNFTKIYDNTNIFNTYLITLTFTDSEPGVNNVANIMFAALNPLLPFLS